MLINNIESLSAIIPTVISTEFNRYAQALSDAEVWFTKNIAGRALFAEVLGSPDDDPLFEKSRLVVAYRAYGEVIPKLDLRETDNGFAVVNDSVFAPASKDRVAALVASTVSSLNEAIFDLFEYLEDTPELHPQFKLSPSCTIIEGSFLPTMRKFKKYGTFEGTYYDWIKTAPRHRTEISLNMHPIISPELCYEIIAQVESESITPANAVIIDDLCYALSFLCSDKPVPAGNLLGRVRRVIEASPDDYPAFKASKLYDSIINKPKLDSSVGVGIFGI